MPKMLSIPASCVSFESVVINPVNSQSITLVDGTQKLTIAESRVATLLLYFTRI